MMEKRLRGLSVLFACLLAVFLVRPGAALAAVPGPKADAVAVQALSDIALSQGDAAADELLERVADGSIALDQWQLNFKQYFTTGAFTTPLAQFWEAAIVGAEDAERPRLMLLSSLCACEAISAALPRGTSLPASLASLSTAFSWMEYVCGMLGTNERTAAFAALTKAFAQQDLRAYGREPQCYGFYVQAAITLREYAGNDAQARGTVARLLGLEAGPQAVWQAHGILLLDNGAFGAGHIASLNSLLSAIPRELHNIWAIIVPEATGVPAGTPFATSGQIVYLPYVPMEAMTSQLEFVTNGGPVAPSFTMTAAQEIVRAVQAVQFAKRPALAARRDIILANAQLHEERYLRHYRIVSPAVYFNNPDDLLPGLAYIYFIDSRAVFDMAAALFSLKAQEPMDQFLLLADLLSGGGNAAPLYATGLDGTVNRASASIGRVHGSWVRAPQSGNPAIVPQTIPLDAWFCNAIAYGGTSYVFEFDEHGITNRFLRK